jgi:hypothetical protein
MRIREPRCGMTGHRQPGPARHLHRRGLRRCRRPVNQVSEYSSWRPALPGGTGSGSTAAKMITPSDLGYEREPPLFASLQTQLRPVRPVLNRLICRAGPARTAVVNGGGSDAAGSVSLLPVSAAASLHGCCCPAAGGSGSRRACSAGWLEPCGEVAQLPGLGDDSHAGQLASPVGDPFDDLDHIVHVALGVGAAGDGQAD